MKSLYESLLSTDLDVTDNDIAADVIYDIILKNNPKLGRHGLYLDFWVLDTTNKLLIKSIKSAGLSIIDQSQIEKELDTGNAVLVIYPFYDGMQCAQILVKEGWKVLSWPSHTGYTEPFRGYRGYLQYFKEVPAGKRQAGRYPAISSGADVAAAHAQAISLGPMTFDNIRKKFNI